MTKRETELLEELARMIRSRWCPFDNYDVEEEWERFFRLVFKLNPASEVMMQYHGSLFDLATGR